MNLPWENIDPSWLNPITLVAAQVVQRPAQVACMLTRAAIDQATQFNVVQQAFLRASWIGVDTITPLLSTTHE
jgi:hypothetical protein